MAENGRRTSFRPSVYYQFVAVRTEGFLNEQMYYMLNALAQGVSAPPISKYIVIENGRTIANRTSVYQSKIKFTGLGMQCLYK